MKLPAIYDGILTQSECQELINYLHTPGDRYDERPDVTSKHPLWNRSEWPQHIVEKALDKTVPKGYVIDEITIMDSKIGLKPHSDWIEGYDTVLIALDADPIAHTVFFDNHIPKKPVPTHPAAFVTKTPWSPFQYEMPDKNGKLFKINDIREFYEQCKSSPETVKNFEITDDFLTMLETLIVKRAQPRLEHDDQTDETGYVQTTPRISDYESWVTNYRPQGKFPEDIHQQYLSHVPIEDLHGLSIDKIFEWKNGSVIHFHGTQIHSASSTHNKKTFMTIFLHWED